MKIHVSRADEAFHFVGTNESGNTVLMDSSPEHGGQGKGARPTELLIMGMGGCSGIDVVSILNKQRQEIRRFDMELDAERDTEQVPAVFKQIHIHYVLDGDLEPEKVRKAIELSLGRYCSVSRMLEKTATISWSYSVNGERFEGAGL